MKPYTNVGVRLSAADYALVLKAAKATQRPISQLVRLALRHVCKDAQTARKIINGGAQ